MVKLNICNICRHEDFGYCGLRDSTEDLTYEHDEHSDLTKCSGFIADKELTERLFQIKKK
jgi:hypothetical protein